MQKVQKMSLDFELISLSKVTARGMPENLHLHTCEGGFWFFCGLWPQALTSRALENAAE